MYMQATHVHAIIIICPIKRDNLIFIAAIFDFPYVVCIQPRIKTILICGFKSVVPFEIFQCYGEVLQGSGV